MSNFGPKEGRFNFFFVMVRKGAAMYLSKILEEKNDKFAVEKPFPLRIKEFLLLFPENVYEGRRDLAIA